LPGTTPTNCIEATPSDVNNAFCVLIKLYGAKELYNEIGLNAQAVAEVLREWMKEMKIVTTQFQ
jgi:hypothetical protein